MNKVFFLLLFFVLLSPGKGEAQANPLSTEKLESYIKGKSDKIKIIVLDSGLGGLSVMGEIENLLTDSDINKVELIFINALPDAKRKYNLMGSEEEKISAFNNVLTKVETKFRPDIILVACNTLSVITSKTGFYKTTEIPVIDIVGFGVDEFINKLSKNSNSALLILGTETTIKSESHKQKLLDHGIKAERIFTKSCPNLESEIQMDPESDMVSNLIDFYIDDALNLIEKKPEKLFIGLCCSHYGYSEKLFAQVIKDKFVSNFEIINPNHFMAGLFRPVTGIKKGHKIETKVYSSVKISKQEINSIAKSLRKSNYRKTAKSLENYYFDKTIINN